MASETCACGAVTWRLSGMTPNEVTVYGARHTRGGCEPAADPAKAGLRGSLLALADEWGRLADGNEAARGRNTTVAAYYRKHACELRAALAAEPAAQPTYDMSPGAFIESVESEPTAQVDVAVLDDEDREALAQVLPCSQCGGYLTDRACGPTHALLAAEPDRHRLVAPFVRVAVAARLAQGGAES